MKLYIPKLRYRGLPTLNVTTCLAMSMLVHAQVYTPPPAEASPAAPTQTTSTSPSGSGGSGVSPIGQEIPMLNPISETVTLAGVEFPLQDTRVIKSRFEKYLNQPAEEQEEAVSYHQKIEEILSTLSPENQDPLALSQAARLLPEASFFESDGRLSETLFGALYKSMLAKSSQAELKQLNIALEKQKQELIRQDEWDRQRRGKRELRIERGQDQQAAKVLDEKAGLKGRNRELEFGRILERAEENRGQGKLIELTSKVNYQANMVGWIAQRRFDHVLMASRFYPRVWTKGDDKLHADEEAKLPAEFKNSVGFSPTVTGLESIANEAILDTKRAVRAVDHLIGQGNLHAASNRLLEAFALGEYLSPITTFPMEKKGLVQTYIRDLDHLYQAVNARDYERASALVLSLKSQSNDFPESQATSYIAAYTSASDFKFMAAMAALNDGDRTTAAANAAEGIEIWPLNPMKEDYKDLIIKLTNGGEELKRLRDDFDRLFDEKNYRQVYAQRDKFRQITIDDSVRSEKLTQITQNILRIDNAINLANGLANSNANNRNYYAAWEALYDIREEFPDDPQLARELEVLTPHVAEFTKAIYDAKELEGRRNPQLGSAIAHYLKARSIYPSSRLASDSLERLSEQVLSSY